MGQIVKSLRFAAYSGNLTRKTVCPFSLAASMLPPCSSTICLAIASPSPAPPVLLWLPILLLALLLLAAGVSLFSQSGALSPADGIAETTIRTFAQAHGFTLSDYPPQLVALLERNPETEEFVLNYPLCKDSAPKFEMEEYADDTAVPLLTGYEDGTFTVHDPNSRANSAKRWSYERLQGQIRNLWAYQKTA